MSEITGYIDTQIDSGLVDPGEIADKVLTNTPSEVLNDALRGFLVLAVRERIRERNHQNPMMRGAEVSQRGTAHPAKEITSKPRSGGRAQAVRSLFAQQRAKWQADVIWTGTKRLALGDATFGDLVAAANALRVQAGKLTAQAQRYQTLADVLADLQLGVVRALPDDAVRELIERADVPAA